MRTVIAKYSPFGNYTGKAISHLCRYITYICDCYMSADAESFFLLFCEKKTNAVFEAGQLTNTSTFVLPFKVVDCKILNTNHVNKLLLTVAPLFFGCISTYAQSPYENNVFRPEIKSVEFYNIKAEGAFPIINLNSSDQVLLGFDNLKGGTQTYNYTLEHCDATWNPDNISSAESLKNYNEDRITDYSYSTNTIQKYTHYQLKLPNENIAPKISGNFILKVYEDGDPIKIIITRKLFVVNQSISIISELVPSNDVGTRQTDQKLNFTLNYGNLRVQNPATDLRTLVMQNERIETAQINTQPNYIRGNQLLFNDVNTNDFAGGNEYRHFDTRSLKVGSEHIAHIYRADTANTVVIQPDPVRNQPNYSFQYDIDGNFNILNDDNSINPRIDADYSHMIFSLVTKRSPNEGTVYINGKFNDYRIDERSKMDYDAASGRFVTSLLLKQGVYDYEYVWVDKASGKHNLTALEGSYFETENNYQILVYYRPPGGRWDELNGYQTLNSSKK